MHDFSRPVYAENAPDRSATNLPKDPPEKPMKIRLIIALVGLAISFALPTFAQQTNTPDPQLRQQLDALAKSFEDAWNSNDAVALAALFTEDAVLVNDSGPVNGREAIKKYYTDLFQNVHFSNNVTTYAPESPHIVCPNCDEVWENGAWSMTWQVKGGDPVHGKGYHASVAVREGGVLKKRLLVSNVTPAPAAPAQTK
jgi:ketosteroid isomerase-like protein